MGKHEDPKSPKDQPVKPPKPNGDQHQQPGGSHAGTGGKDGGK